MLKQARTVFALSLAATSIGLAVATTTPASACTGDPCDGICATYPSLPSAVQTKVFHSTECPLR